jgi:Bacterial TSP3 repeat
MKLTRAVAAVVGAALATSLWTGAVSAQTESASAEDGAPASEAPAETAPAPTVPLGANLTPPLGALPPGPVIPSAAGSGQPGSSNVSMAPGTLTAGVAREGANAVRAPEAEPAPAPVAEAAPEPVADTTVAEPSEPVAADIAVASAEDRDGDNYLDTLEVEAGLDPDNPDTDGDGVADGDEVTIYLTDPHAWDTDGDGLSDGEELFATNTNPLLWDTNGNGTSDGEERPV